MYDVNSVIDINLFLHFVLSHAVNPVGSGGSDNFITATLNGLNINKVRVGYCCNGYN